MDNTLDLIEFLDHIEYCLSLRFKEKWRHRFSTHFVAIFQEKLCAAFEKQKRLKISSLVSTYTRKHKYSLETVMEFLDCIEVEDLYPVVYEDEKYLEEIKKPYLSPRLS